MENEHPAAGKDWRQKGKRAAEDEMVDSITNSMDMNLSKLQEIVEDGESWRACKEWNTTYWLDSNIEEFTCFFSGACCSVAHMVACFTFKYLIPLCLLLHTEWITDLISAFATKLNNYTNIFFLSFFFFFGCTAASSLTRYWTQTTATKAQNPNHWTTTELLQHNFLKFIFLLLICHFCTYFWYVLVPIYRFSILSLWSVSSSSGSTLLFVDLADRAEPGDHPPAALSMQTQHTAGLPPTSPPSGPLLTPRVVSSDSPNTTALPPWTLYSVPQPTLAPLFPLRHPAPFYSSPESWRVPSCLISDYGPALLLQWLQTCKLVCHPPSAAIPSSMRSEP